MTQDSSNGSRLESSCFVLKLLAETRNAAHEYSKSPPYIGLASGPFQARPASPDMLFFACSDLQKSVFGCAD